MNSESTKLAVLPTDYPRTSVQVVEAEERYQIEGANAPDILRALVVVVHRYTGDTHVVLGTSSSIVHIDLTPEDRLDSIQIGETDSLSTGDLTVFVSENSIRTVYNTILFTPLRIQLLHLHLALIIQNRSISIGRISLRTQKEEEILPDPCAPLNWCEWPGPITSVFSSNAAKYPEKAAIITQTHSHTYASLLKAANTLSNHLLKHGVERGDVVMIYAHRSADLVLAVLGTLSAGATFSVIDPAYPPERQIVYLSVACPRAVIILQGAQDVNPVDESVRAYWEKDLGGVKVCIEGVSLGEDGTVYADGSNLDVDAKDPGIVLGPDSVATLSFTSGSTGIPKGVRGRHYSLTHFFPWMATRFGLSTESRFTMLSGIAHDPIQRDIFTPLFLGASLHVPPSSAIGTPGALAAWMDEKKVTVTHLTPAMGQLVTTTGGNEGENAGSVAPSIPSLRTAFFVGDLLTKRDVARLQALARNVVVVNMYGTTETQRAVSYHAIPSLAADPAFLSTQKEVIPAGKGMKDVQLLVVNRNDKSITCAVGEPGEIYVRSGGLAEGYLVPPTQTDGEPDPNKEKFVRNWFRYQDSVGKGEDSGYADTLSSSSDPARQYWHGVRDRMYRSGDLGRYDTEGGVECIGRADNQIKIRGFRIELGEVDTHLAAHPGVRENVTLVRRDKDEEKMLVSYFVPLSSWKVEGSENRTSYKEEGTVEGGIQRYAPLIKDIRAHLKKKLPGYSIPTLIIPLARMPLNPNGKIDKPALPFPDTAAAVASLSAVSASALAVANASANLHADITPTQRVILKLFASLLPGFSSDATEESLPPIPLNESFFDLGGHSILATRLVFELRRAFPVLKDRIGLGVVYSKHGGEIASVRGLASIFDVLRGEDLGLPVDHKLEIDAKDLNGVLGEDQEEGEDNYYAQDLETLISSHLASSYPSYTVTSTRGLHVFLTGATGFLGAFILQQLLQTQPVSPSSFVSHVTCLVRASSVSSAVERLRDSCASRGVWSDSWVSSNRLTVLAGDLALPHFGVTSSQWEKLESDVDVVMHNGALVHWVYPYERLKAPNVIGTLTAVELAGKKEKPKSLVFVSSTSVLDTPSYVRIGSSVISQNLGSGVLETDTLETARRGLKTGYGQSKWVAEKLLFEAGKRGLSGYIIRPGYVVGESKGGVTNTDDFVWRMVKGCVQLGSVPDMSNGVNMVPVDRVAMCCVKAVTVSPASLNASKEKHPGGNMSVMHVTARPLPTFNDLFNALREYGWAVERTEYVQWRLQLEAHVMNKARNTSGEVEEDNALFPLLHFVLDDLPTSTKAPMLDDRTTIAVVERGGLNEYNPPNTIDEELMGRYFAWLVRAGFLSPPQDGEAEKSLPLLEGGVTKAAGRSGI
ncbi:aminoadipate-semialdehyde dehydrogenase [Lentinula boryana]|uniref:Alpha-aminoadipate reductase n=1 Tax=Lentinula boryana TaxID=40481 RepID=A0ABQ8QBP4_9AGAR|nr:aminoadipate-semialdehyde dehydrogenase [Lentinula boryana]